MYEKLKKFLQNSVDDEFFHTICHIDPQIRDKIKKGEFVELEKLLSKPRSMKPRSRTRVDIVGIEGTNRYSLVENSDNDTKITNVAKWTKRSGSTQQCMQRRILHEDTSCTNTLIPYIEQQTPSPGKRCMSTIIASDN